MRGFTNERALSSPLRVETRLRRGLEEVTYAQAIREALYDAMVEDESVVVLGQAVDDPKPTYGTTAGLAEAFGPGRVVNTPLSEEGMTGAAVGMALAGLRPVLIHIRMDFLLLAMNQLVNMAAKIRWMYGGRLRCPVVIRAIIGKSWGQGPQHSQGLYPMLCHVPGVRVAAPATPSTVGQVIGESLARDEPVVIVEHRLLYSQTDEGWPADERADVTLFAVSYMAVEARHAAWMLRQAGVNATVVVPAWLSPLDASRQLEGSVAGTRALVTVDCSWVSCGLGAEVIARCAEQGLLTPGKVRRLGFAPTACPTSPALEATYYPTARTIAQAAYELVTGDRGWIPIAEVIPETFRGPF